MELFLVVFNSDSQSTPPVGVIANIRTMAHQEYADTPQVMPAYQGALESSGNNANPIKVIGGGQLFPKTLLVVKRLEGRNSPGRSVGWQRETAESSWRHDGDQRGENPISHSPSLPNSVSPDFFSFPVMESTRVVVMESTRVRSGMAPSSPAPEGLAAPAQVKALKGPTANRGTFSCSVCGKVFGYKTSLHRHIKFECGKEPQFPCPHCDHRSKHKGDLKKHIAGRHSELCQP